LRTLSSSEHAQVHKEASRIQRHLLRQELGIVQRGTASTSRRNNVDKRNMYAAPTAQVLAKISLPLASDPDFFSFCVATA
jgi:hypothetical protein